MFKQYYRLTKPGIIYGNSLPAIAGFILASHGRHFDFWLLLEMLGSLSLIIGSACAVNNVTDRDIDKRMARTSRRALVTGKISPRRALSFAAALGIAGFAALLAWTNWRTVLAATVAYISYTVFYAIAKRRSIHGTLVGTIPGALPPVIGYCSVSNRFDGGALILFLIMVFWQLPHFYAIAIYRFKDYKEAGLPVMPVRKGYLATKIQVLCYIAAFTIASAALWAYDYTGRLYLIIITVLGLAWLGIGLRGFSRWDNKLWGRRMFLFSLIVLIGLSLMVSVNAV